MKNAAPLFLDGLTGLHHRAYFLDRLSEAAEIQQPALALLLVDLDNLFLINMERGRDSGDRALVALALTLRRSARSGDTVARLGGDQFALLLPGTSLVTATQFACGIRSLVGRAHDVHPDIGTIDVCIGVAARPDGGPWRAHDLLALADLRLNSAKRSRHRPGLTQQVWAGPPDLPDGDDDS
ncbi:MAG: GGDEF domain-containing protein [Burkholderiales bacterium]